MVNNAQYNNFTFFGFVSLIVFFLVFGIGKFSRVIVWFLGVLLLAMVLLNWARIEPLIIKKEVV